MKLMILLDEAHDLVGTPKLSPALQFVTLDHLDIAPNLHNDVSHLLAQKGAHSIPPDPI